MRAVVYRQAQRIASELAKFHETLTTSLTFSPLEYCSLFAQKKAYGGEATGTSGPP